MADEIINKLGFDASDAIAELGKLDQALLDFESKMQGVRTTMQLWNRQAGRVVNAMVQIEKRGMMASQAVLALQQALHEAAGITVPTPGAAPVAPGAAPSGTLTVPPTVPPTTVSAINAAKDATRKWTMSWETMVRVVATQLIVRMISQVRDVMQDAIKTNIDYSRSLALIKTIEPGQSLQQFSDAVRRLSDAMNVPIMDVSQGLYDVVSQQVEGAEAQQAVLKSALEFAKVTGTSAADAVQLLTSTMHAFGNTTDDVDSIASRFFRTIDIGNVTAKDFIVSFGRVAPVAKEMGASLEEAQAAYAVLTQKGVRAEEAATQIAATFTAFIKPSEDMAKALRKIGVSSGEQAINAYGFMGAIQKVIQTTDGSADSMGKLFRNVRALRDIFALARDGGEAFEKALKEIMETSRGEVRSKFGEMMQTDAEKVSSAMNRIKNAITVDIGGTLVRTLAGIFNFAPVGIFIGALKGAVVVVGVTIGAVALLGGAMLLFTANAKLAAVSNSLFNTSLFTGKKYATKAAAGARGLCASLAQLAVLAVAAYFTLQMLNDEYLKMLQAPQKKFRERYTRDVEDFREKELQKVDIAKAKNDKIIQQAHAQVALIRRSYFRQLDEAKETNEAMVADAKSTLGRIVDVHKKYAAQLRQVALTANKQIQDSQKREYDVSMQLEDARFKFRTERYNEATVQMRMYAKRADELAAEASRALARAATPEEAARALEIFNRAKAAAQEAASIAGQTGDVRDKFWAEKAIEEVLQRQIRAEREFQSTQARTASDAARAAAAQGAKAEKLKQLMKEIVENLNLFTKKGEPLPAEERAKKLQAASKAMADFWAEAFGAPGKPIDISKLIQFETLQRRLQTELEAGVSRAELGQLADLPKTMADVETKIRGTVANLEKALTILPDAVKKFLPKDFKLMDIGEQLQEIDSAIDTWSHAADAAQRGAVANAETFLLLQKKQEEMAGIAAVTASRISQWYQTVRGFLGTIPKRLGPRWYTFPIHLQQEAVNLARFNQQVDYLSRSTTVTMEMWKQLRDRIAEARRAQTGAKPVAWTDLERRLEVLREIIKLREKERQEAQRPAGPTVKEANQGMQQLEDRTRGAQEATRDLGGTSAATDQQLSQLDVPTMDPSGLYSIEGALDWIVMSAYNAVSALYAVQAAAMSAEKAGEGALASRGGKMRHLAAGGNVGTDVIPAMLSPGEFVMSASATRKFASQLVAMNAGVRPTFRSEGGSVTNIGDINVTVRGGDTGRHTARDIAAELRRELRRGTATL